VGGQSHVPASVAPGKIRYQFYRRLGWALGRSGRVQKISCTLGLDARTAQPVESRYTDCAIPFPVCSISFSRCSVPLTHHSLMLQLKFSNDETYVCYCVKLKLVTVNGCSSRFFYVKVKGNIPTRHVIRILFLSYFDWCIYHIILCFPVVIIIPF
jgi:hypothetical protein